MVDGVVWVYVREDIDILKGQEMFLAYGWVYWWRRINTLSSVTKGACARMYPEISARLNAGHVPRSIRHKVRTSRTRNDAPNVPLAESADPISNRVDIWKHFINHPDGDISKIATDLLSEKYVESKRWSKASNRPCRIASWGRHGEKW